MRSAKAEHSRSRVLYERSCAAGAHSRATAPRAAVGVVNGARHGVGDRGVAPRELEGEVEHEPLADFPLGLADAVMRVQGEADDLDAYEGTALVLVVDFVLFGL